MATVTKGRTFVSGETVTPAKLNELVDNATVTSIVDADVSASAAIALSKLATGALPTAITVANANIVSGVDASKLTTGTLPADRIGSSAVTPARLAAKVTFPNYAAAEGRNYTQIYQAATDGYLVVRAVGSFRNGIQIVVGTTSPPTAVIWFAGDDINTNTKYVSSGLVPITKDIYYAVQPISGVDGFETVLLEWYPIVS